MDDLTSSDLVESYLAKPYWPWPLAFAYCQSAEVREDALQAAVEVLEYYSSSEGLSEFTASSMVARVYEVVTGRSYMGHPVEGHDRSGERYTITSVEEVYWFEVSALEKPLIDALEAGRLCALGRKSLKDALTEIKPTDWVGAEVDPDETADLVRAGWRVKRHSLERALGDVERHTLFYDIHLSGAEVRKFVDAETMVECELTPLPSLPNGASTNDHKHASLAHEAAKLLRRDRSLKPQTAFKAVAPQEPMRSEDTICRAIRSAFDKMYQKDGTHHPN